MIASVWLVNKTEAFFIYNAMSNPPTFFSGSYRAAVILIEKEQVALIERYRQGLHYFTFPGGHVDEGESPEQAAIREVSEELGLQVVILRSLAKIWWHGKPQYYYLAESVGGVFGTGTAKEMVSPFPEDGTYKPIWIPIQILLDLPVKPRLMAEMLIKAQIAGWPDAVPVIYDND